MNNKFQFIVSECGATTACPTIFKDIEGKNLVIIGQHDQAVISDPDVSAKIDPATETAVKIPETLIADFLNQALQIAFAHKFSMPEEASAEKPVLNKKAA